MPKGPKSGVPAARAGRKDVAGGGGGAQALPEATPSAAARKGPPAWLCRLAGAAMLALGAAALWTSWREVMAERSLWVARTRAERDIESRVREIDLQRAQRWDPTNPLVISDRARLAIRHQKTFFQQNQFNLMDAKKLEEALAMLEEIDETYYFRPGLLRVRGETAMMLADLYGRRGDRENMQRWIEKGYADILEASRQLPRPKGRSEEFNPGAVVAAQHAGRDDLAVDFLMRMNRFGERSLLEQSGILRTATQAWFALGLLPHQMREIHAALLRTPDDPTLLGGLRLSATELGQRVAAIKILENLERANKLTPAGRATLDALRAQKPIPFEEGTPDGEETTGTDGG